MKMLVIGRGDLAPTHAACMASIGHDVIRVDIDDGKVALLNSGKGWFREPGLDPLLAEDRGRAAPVHHRLRRGGQVRRRALYRGGHARPC